MSWEDDARRSEYELNSDEDSAEISRLKERVRELEDALRWCWHYLPLPETGEYQCLYKEDGLSRTCPESDCPIIRALQGWGGGGISNQR